MMDWNRLRVLDAVARTGSVAGAAQALHATGPAISHHLRRIEAETGHAVVEPFGRGIRLTSSGMVLASYARRMAELAQQAENDVSAGGELVGTVRVAAVASAVRSLLVPRLAAFRHEHPGIQVDVSDGETVHHLQELHGGQVDLVLAESWSHHPVEVPTNCCAIELFTEPVVWALPADAAAPRAVPEWTSCPSGSDAYRALVQRARTMGIEPTVRYEVADHMTQLALVSAGLAGALLPESATYSHPDHVTTFLCEPAMSRSLVLIQKHQSVPRVVELLIEVLRTPTASDFGDDPSSQLNRA